MRHSVAIVVVLASCAAPRDTLPDIADLYRDAALNEVRNPVVVIHGILGARLAERTTGRTVWGAFTGDHADPATPDGARLMALPVSVPGGADSYDPETAEVVASGPLETLKLSLLFQILSVDVYRNIIRTLGAGMYRDRLLVDASSPAYAEDHFTCYSFFYDWRRDNVTNAIQLHRFLLKAREEIAVAARGKIARLRAAGGADRVAEARELEEWLARGYRFDVVAHSMGGLIARYYLRYGATDLPAGGGTPAVTWKGAEQIDRLVIVGTPNLGSMVALEQLLEGYRPSFVLPVYDQAVLGTMASIYQLLPRRRHKLLLGVDGQPIDLDVFDPAVWERNAWGMFDPSVATTVGHLLPGLSAGQRRDRVRRYVAWCLRRAQEFHRALDHEPEAPCPAEIHLFAADSQPTLTRARVAEVAGRLRVDFRLDAATRAWGDMTVARYSALGDERQGQGYSYGVRTTIPFKNETFLSDDHIGLTRNPHFSDNLLYLLLEKRPPAR